MLKLISLFSESMPFERSVLILNCHFASFLLLFVSINYGQLLCVD